MPSEKLVPYRFELYERRNPDNRYDLTQLQSYANGFTENNILDLIEQFLSHNQGGNLEDVDSDKTFVVEEFSRDGNIVEGIVSTGYHGYKAELRDVETGNITHIKDEDEAEQMPLYFLMYLPELQGSGVYDDGKSLFIVLHQVNRIGVKGKLSKHLKEKCLKSVSDTTMKIDPVYTEEVLEKIINADRIAQLDFRVKKIPGDDESKYQLIEGLDTEETGSRSLVLRPEHGGSFEQLRNIARQVSDSDIHFAELVDQDVESLTATIQKEGGRSETVSLLEEEVAMRKDLDDDLSKQNGLITADSLRSETNELMNSILNTDIVEQLDGQTDVQR